MSHAPGIDSPGTRTAASEPLISVIVPYRNASRWLRACLESLQNQDLPDASYEIVAVDNGLNDDSPTILQDFPSVRVVRETRVGAYSARNRGVANSRGAVLAFTDADCVPRRNWLRNIVAALEDPEVHLILGQRLTAADSLFPILWSHYEQAKETFVFSGNTLSYYYGHTNNMAVRRATFEAYGPFLEWPRGADTIFVQRLVGALGGRAVAFHSDVQVRHLELTGPADVLRKLFIYGRSSTHYSRVVAARPLTPRDRWRIFKETAVRRKYSFLQRTLLLGFLATGVAAWQLGMASARVAMVVARR